MAAGIFNPENDFWRLIEKLVDLFLLSVFWLVCSLPVFTLGPATAALYRSPVSCYAAVDADKQVLGFACYDATAKDFFGPTGVMESQRGKGIGAALLIACMQAMAAEGYAYAVIGGAGPVAFYEKVVGATVIPDSVPGPYRDMF